MRVPPTERFSSRVQNYVKYRPSYPAAVVGLLALECGLRPGAPVADLGSGTGIFAKLLLDAGAVVYAVEPNGPMRTQAEAALGGRTNFHAIDGTAESTTLPDHSVRLVTAAQAFHWFDRAATKRECGRILAPDGHIALVWNDRLTDASAFLVEYEEALREHSSEYAEVNHRELPREAIEEFFAPEPVHVRSFDNSQRFDLDGFLGRVFSSSYAPDSGQTGHDALRAALVDMFDRHAEDGIVEFLYRTQVYWGRNPLPSGASPTEGE